MNLKIPLRVGRILVVLALIVALLVSSIPMPARAVGAGLLYNIAANTGVNLALRAIGVGPGNSPAVFNNLVTTIGEAVSSATAPFAQLLITGSSGNFRSFLSTDFLSWVLSWLFDSGTVSSEGAEFLTTASITFASNSYELVGTYGAPFAVYYFCCNTGATSNSTGNKQKLIAVISPDYPSSTVKVNGSTRTVSTSIIPGFRCVEIVSSSGGLLSPPTGPVISVDFGDLADNAAFTAAIASFDPMVGSVSTSEDLTLDSVGSSLDSAPYSGWVGQSVSNDDQAFVPVSVPSLDSSTISAQTQTQAQAGTIPDAVVDEIIAGEEVIPDTGTIADVITSIRALGADIVAAIQAVPAAIADVFSPPAISEEYMISLSDFFPFCLPFDIYDLLSALAADPQAPVFEWTIAVPRWGISHDIEIDLSEWDDIARLFRTFELGAFVLGLALITRQKFLRS